MKKAGLLLFAFTIILFAKIVSGQEKITKVAFIGNSITAGTGLSNATLYAYPSQLANMLTTDWQIGNFAVSGRTMLKKGDFPIWAEQQFTDALNFEPNIVVIMLGTNDSKYYNWAFKDDFYKDYVSMIDTFSNLASKPEIYVCFPSKVFSKLYDIDEVVLHDEIRPIITQVAQDKNVKTIDFYTPTIDKPTLFSDGIHPNVNGAHFFAEIMFTALSGNPYTKLFDENLLLRKNAHSISAGSLNMLGASAIDGDLYSSWSFKGFPSSLTIDIGSLQQTDQFELFFREYKTRGIQYTIETSTDSSVWNMAIDKTQREDIISSYDSNKIPATEMRYVRLTITGTSSSSDDYIKINEFKALKYSGYDHAPVISAEFVRSAATLSVIPTDNILIMTLLRYNKSNKAFDVNTIVKDFSAPYVFKFTGSANTKYQFMSNSYSNGTEIYSDTISMTIFTPTVNIPLNNLDQSYFQVFPNPASGKINIVTNRKINEKVNIKVIGIKGELIETIKPLGLTEENKMIVWNGTDFSGKKLNPGIYFIRIEGSTIHETLKVVLK